MADIGVAIVSVDGSVWSGTAKSVTCTTIEGEIGILPGRQPILAQMAAEGVVTVHSSTGDFLVFAVSGGLLSCTGSNVIIMAEHAYPAEGLSAEALEKQLVELLETATDEEKAALRAKVKAAHRLAAA